LTAQSHPGLTEATPAGTRSSLPVSVIIPVRNEEGSIEALLQALVEQSYPPAEIVITDGGSQDRTREMISGFMRRTKIPIRLIKADAAFPGRGRNLAIAHAAQEWIATTDGGNVPDRHWLHALVEAAEQNPQARLIYGRYVPVTDTYFTSCAAIAYLKPPDVFSPSIVSSLMQRTVWRETGGFREDLRSGEDLLFFKKIDALHILQARADKAVVYWSLQPSLGSTMRRFCTYSRYGMKAGLAAEWQIRVARLYVILVLLAATAWFWWPLILLPVLVLILRAQRRIHHWYASKGKRRWVEILDPRRVLTVTSISLAIDVAMFCGILVWFWRDVLRNPSAASQAPS
jgi:glycosyltransferase involved in cell wall biosynthesis